MRYAYKQQEAVGGIRQVRTLYYERQSQDNAADDEPEGISHFPSIMPRQPA